MKEGYLLGKLTVSKVVYADINLSYIDLSCSKRTGLNSFLKLCHNILKRKGWVS